MNKIRERWSAGSAAIAGWLQIPGALHAEALARCGYDALVIDMQHSPTDFSTAVAMMTAIEHAGAEPMVRVQRSEPEEIMKLLDCGAYGIIAPMIETAQQARELASAVHYAPRGVRSFGARPMMRYGESYMKNASETFVIFAMIETRLGIENLDEILSVDGLDGVFIGPADLALSLGCAPVAESQDQPQVMEAVDHIRIRAHAAGKRVGMFCNGSAFAREKIEEGFDFVSVAPDLLVLTTGVRKIVAETRGASAA